MMRAALPLLSLLLLSIVAPSCSLNSFWQRAAREKFEARFNETCQKYPFVEDWYSQFERQRYDDSTKYAISVFFENNRIKQGGLGDKLAGVVNVIAYALRTGRVLLIQGDSGFEDAFQPKLRPSSSSLKLNWRDRSHFNWTNEYLNGLNVFHITGCVNPYRQKDEMHCRLNEKEDYTQKVVTVRSNRAYICRWSQELDSPAYTWLTKKQGIHDETSNLFDVAGCLLRLAMWPTDALWERVEEILNTLEINNIGNEEGNSTNNYAFQKQVGMHFRCGDIEYSGKDVGANCIVPNSTDRLTSVLKNELLADGTPLDLGECGANLMKPCEKGRNSTEDACRYRHDRHVFRGYIASDSPSAARQMHESMGPSHENDTLVTPKGCHVEMDKSRDCSFNTIAYWFALALSESLVVQGRKINKNDNYTIPSGFSRYAAMYGLKTTQGLRFGQECKQVDMITQSRSSQGTWKCLEKHSFDENSLLRMSDSKEIFVIRNHTRRSIPNWDTFQHEGFKLRDVQVLLSEKEWSHIPLGAPLEPIL